MGEAIAAVGLAASIVQLLKFGTEVVCRLQDYRKRSKEIPTVFHDISVQLPLLLADLRATKDRNKKNGLPSDVVDSVATIVSSCQDHINVSITPFPIGYNGAILGPQADTFTPLLTFRPRISTKS